MKLMRGFPSSQSQITEGNISAYLDATSGCSMDALERSVQQFLSGKVEGHNNSFMPTAAELATNARQWDYALGMVSADRQLERVVSYPIGAKPPDGLVPGGILTADFGEGPIDMTKLTYAEQEEAFRTKGVPPKEIAAGVPKPQIRKI